MAVARARRRRVAVVLARRRRGVGQAGGGRRERRGDERRAGRSRHPPDHLHIATPIPALRSRARRPAIFSADAPASIEPTARAAKESLLIPEVFAALSAVPGMGMPPPMSSFGAGMLARPASEGRSARLGRAPSPASNAAGRLVSPAPPGGSADAVFVLAAAGRRPAAANSGARPDIGRRGGVAPTTDITGVTTCCTTLPARAAAGRLVVAPARAPLGQAAGESPSTAAPLPPAPTGRGLPLLPAR